MTMQVVDEKQLRKLLRRLEDKEVASVKAFIEAIASGADGLSGTSLTDLLGMKKVKENQHMTSLLKEIREYLDAGNKDAATKAAKRVLEVKPAVITLRGNTHIPVRIVMPPEPTLKLEIPEGETEAPVTEEL